MDVYKFMTGLFGAGFLAMFVLANLALKDRDDALRLRAEMGDVELICRVVSESN